jgi:hypothetical protein
MAAAWMAGTAENPLVSECATESPIEWSRGVVKCDERWDGKWDAMG